MVAITVTVFATDNVGCKNITVSVIFQQQTPYFSMLYKCLISNLYWNYVIVMCVCVYIYIYIYI